MIVGLWLVAAFLWWKSAELILTHGWTRDEDLRRYDIFFIRAVALFGPVVAVLVWFAWLWCDAPETAANPLVRPRRTR